MCVYLAVQLSSSNQFLDIVGMDCREFAKTKIPAVCIAANVGVGYMYVYARNTTSASVTGMDWLELSRPHYPWQQKPD